MKTTLCGVSQRANKPLACWRVLRPTIHRPQSAHSLQGCWAASRQGRIGVVWLSLAYLPGSSDTAIWFRRVLEIRVPVLFLVYLNAPCSSTSPSAARLEKGGFVRLEPRTESGCQH